LIMRHINNNDNTIKIHMKCAYISFYIFISIFIVVLILFAGCTSGKKKTQGNKDHPINISVDRSKNPKKSEGKIPEPPVVKTHFPSVKSVSLDTLLVELGKQSGKIAESGNMKKEFHEFTKRHNLKETPDLYEEYFRVKILCEATRDAGLWNIRWDTTNEEPRSDKIWSQWKKWKGEKVWREKNEH